MTLVILSWFYLKHFRVMRSYSGSVCALVCVCVLKYIKTPTGFLNLSVNKVVFSPGLRHKSFGIDAEGVSSHSGAFG